MHLWCLGSDPKVAQDLSPLTKDESVTRVGEEPESAAGQLCGQEIGLRRLEGAILLTLEDPHLRVDLVERNAPRSTLQCAIPTVRVNSLPDRLPDGSGEHAADGWICQELPVRFRTWQVEETLRSLDQPRNGPGELARGLAKILPGKPSEFVVIVTLLG